jgi:hypothetical protein
MKPGKRILGATILVNGLAFLLFFAFAAYERNANVIIPSYALKWELSKAFLDFAWWLPALQFLALALALGSMAGKSESLLRDSILPGVLVSALLAVLVLILAPDTETRRYSYLDLSGRFNEALADTRASLNDGRLVDARSSYGVLASIDRLDPRAVELETRLVDAEIKAARVKGPAPAAAVPERDPVAAKEQLAKAEDYFRQQDFYSANWHAKKALSLDSSLAAAKVLSERAWGEILASGGSAADADKAAFFGRKVEAFGYLQSGDAVSAYRLFSEMSREKPSDADVRRYLTQSLAAVETSGFFKDEADAAAAARVFPRFLILVPAGSATSRAGDTATRGATSAAATATATYLRPAAILAAREVAFTPESAFFFDLEYITLGSDGGEILHIVAPYAKLAAGKLFLEAVERERPATVFVPSLVAGGTAPLFVESGLDVLTLYRLAVGQRLPASASTLDLFQGAVAAPRYGLSQKPFMAELLRRLGLPFAIFGAAALGTLVGIRFRPADGKVGRAAWLAVPIMAAAAGFFYFVGEAADRLLSAWVLRILPGPLSLAASAGLRAAVLALLVVIAASLRRHVPESEGD